MPSNKEAAVRPGSTFFTGETEDDRANPVTPTDPTWELLSTTIESITLSPSPNFDNRMGTSNYIAHDRQRTQEEHEVSVTYDLERHPVDGNGEPQDLFGYAAARDESQNIYATLSILDVEEKASILPINTVHNYYFHDKSDSAHPEGSIPDASAVAQREERYARGCVPEEATLSTGSGDTGAASVEMSMPAHKIRFYQFDQPRGDETSYLHLRSVLEDGSTNGEDTDATIMVESVDGGTTEEVTLDSADAASAAATSQPYGSYRIWLPEDLVGTVEVYNDDGSGTDAAGVPQQLLAFIPGQEAYDGIAGDQGVPPVGSGSFGDGTGLEPVPALGSDIRWNDRPGGEQVGGVTVTAANEISTNATNSGLAQDISVGSLELTAEAEVWGEAESYRTFESRLLANSGPLAIDLGTGGQLVFPKAQVSDAGETEEEEGAAVMQVGVTFMALMPDDGSDPIQFPTA